MQSVIKTLPDTIVTKKQCRQMYRSSPIVVPVPITQTDRYRWNRPVPCQMKHKPNFRQITVYFYWECIWLKSRPLWCTMFCIVINRFMHRTQYRFISNIHTYIDLDNHMRFLVIIREYCGQYSKDWLRVYTIPKPQNSQPILIFSLWQSCEIRCYIHS